MLKNKEKQEDLTNIRNLIKKRFEECSNKFKAMDEGYLAQIKEYGFLKVQFEGEIERGESFPRGFAGDQ
jgi:hypothetical protein